MLNSINIQIPSQIGPYRLRGTIGEGAFSIVKLCVHHIDRRQYACKIVPKSLLQERSLLNRFQLEIEIDRQLHHPGIVGVADLCQDVNNFYLFMEFCPNGELFQYIVDRGKLTESEAKSFIWQIFDALQYLHTMNIVHRDMKPENILIDMIGRLKLSDFGLSQFCPPDHLVSTPCGSPCYASPELLSGNPYDGRANDIWGCGVILFAMVTGQLPWTKRNQTQLFAQIRRGEYQIPNFLSQQCTDLITRLMTVDPQTRITLNEVFNHQFMIGAQIPNVPNLPMRIVTLKKVSECFGEPVEEIMVPIQRNVSWGMKEFRSAIRILLRPTGNTKVKMLPELKSFPTSARKTDVVMKPHVMRTLRSGLSFGRPRSKKR
jgi:serine/threonine protein kinase